MASLLVVSTLTFIKRPNLADGLRMDGRPHGVIVQECPHLPAAVE